MTITIQALYLPDIIMILKIWQQLQSVSHLNRKMNFKYGGLTGELKGNVQVEQISDTELIFHEHGLWESKNHRPLTMSNTYHWQLIKNQISLSHLRYGKYSPVFLVDFQPFICKRLKLLQNLLLSEPGVSHFASLSSSHNHFDTV